MHQSAAESSSITSILAESSNTESRLQEVFPHSLQLSVWICVWNYWWTFRVISIQPTGKSQIETIARKCLYSGYFLSSSGSELKLPCRKSFLVNNTDSGNLVHPPCSARTIWTGTELALQTYLLWLSGAFCQGGPSLELLVPLQATALFLSAAQISYHLAQNLS